MAQDSSRESVTVETLTQNRAAGIYTCWGTAVAGKSLLAMEARLRRSVMLEGANGGQWMNSNED